MAFRKGDRHEGVRRHLAYYAQGIDAEADAVRVDAAEGNGVDWMPTCWGADKTEVFVEAEQEFRQATASS